MAKDKPAKAKAEVDYTTYATKGATEMQARFADWVIAKVGLEFGTVKEEKAFREGVRIGTALRIPFQSSDENQAARAEKASAPKAEPAKPAKAAKAAKGKPAETEEAVVAEAVAATKPKAKPAKKAAPSKAAPF